MNPVLNVADAISSVKAHQAKLAAVKSGQGDKVTDVSDPTLSGSVTIPKDPDNNISKIDGAKNDGSAQDVTLGTIGTNEGGAKAPNQPVDGSAKDKTFTTPTSKIAAIAAGVADMRKNWGTISTELDKSAAKVENKDVSTKGDKKVEPVANAVAASTADASKVAAHPVDLTDPKAMFSKLAAFLASSEEGCQAAFALLERAEGQKAAAEIINGARAYQEQQAKLASIQDNSADEFAALPQEVQYELVKTASILKAAAGQFNHPLEQEAFILGIKEAAAMSEAGGMPESGEVNLPGAGGEGGEQAPSLEEIAAVLEQLVQSGQLDQQTAEQLLQELSGQEQAGAAQGAGQDVSELKGLVPGGDSAPPPAGAAS